MPYTVLLVCDIKTSYNLEVVGCDGNTDRYNACLNSVCVGLSLGRYTH